MGNRVPLGETLHARLLVFVDRWRGFDGNEQAGAAEFMKGLLDIYEVDFRPGTVFEQHPVRIPTSRTAGAQLGMFGTPSAPQTNPERMDLYLPKVCVWEMKAPSERNLQKHHPQLLGYWAWVRTRYMVLCNFREFWIYDTDEEGGQLDPKLRFDLAELPERGDALLFLRGDEPDFAARPEAITAEVARIFGRIVREVVACSTNPAMDRERIARFVLQCVFAMFAEDSDLMPAGLFTQAARRADTEGRLDAIWALFDDFAHKDIARTNLVAPYVNGALFDRNHPRIALTPAQIHDIHWAARSFDWKDVRPEIFGSIFEQALDPTERHELGAHFTREADIARVVGPTVVEPWRRRIEALRIPRDAEQAVADLRAYHVLDPACGCGNFLYVVYREMKRLEAALARKWVELQRKVAKRRADIRPPPPGPWFTIHQLHGIEIDPFASFLAKVVLWIGEHLANAELGIGDNTLPLKSLDANIRNADALFCDWPRPEGQLAIVSNPPYLGVRKLRTELGDELVERLFARYPQNRAADYVTYWFTRALEVLRPGERAGYVATKSVAQNESREASIDRILTRGGTLTDAWRNYPWPGEAAVHIGIVNWIMAPWDGLLTLDGQEVAAISAGLTAGVDATRARPIPQNAGICFMGVTPGNREFVLSQAERAEILAQDPSSEAVIRPFLVGRDVNREIGQEPTRWIIDFGTMELEEAERFRGAIRHVRARVYPIRRENRRESRARAWWRFAEPAPNLRAAIREMPQVLAIPCVSPHLIVSRQAAGTCFDHALMVVALSDPYHYAILQSRLHACWAWARGSTLKGDLRYTNTTIFETFPFPLLPDGRYDPRLRPDGSAAGRVAAAAAAFDGLRRSLCQERGCGLTKVHNDLREGRPAMLLAAYEELNDAVEALYAMPAGTWRDERACLDHLLEQNLALTAGALGVEIGRRADRPSGA